MIAEDALQRISETLVTAELAYGHGTDNALDEAWWLLHTVLFGLGDMQEIPADLPVSPEQWQSAEHLLEQRIQSRKPLAYLLGEAWFCGLPFHVDERVLVPRSPIAELIENDFGPLLNRTPTKILDLCTGSGCIGIACAMAFPEAEMVLSELSEDALAVAEMNIRRHGLEGRVKAVQSDIFSNIEGRFDLIVTNPPYVPQAEYAELPVEYSQEPRMGLVCESGGLAIPLQILRQAKSHLTEDGILVLEVGNTWQALNEAAAELPLLWLDFEHGGHGVCAIRAADLP